MVERSAVNRLVVGSNPTSGAIFAPDGRLICSASRNEFALPTMDLGPRLVEARLAQPNPEMQPIFPSLSANHPK